MGIMMALEPDQQSAWKYLELCSRRKRWSMLMKMRIDMTWLIRRRKTTSQRRQKVCFFVHSLYYCADWSFKPTLTSVTEDVFPSASFRLLAITPSSSQVAQYSRSELDTLPAMSPSPLRRVQPLKRKRTVSDTEPFEKFQWFSTKNSGWDYITFNCHFSLIT